MIVEGKIGIAFHQTAAARSADLANHVAGLRLDDPADDRHSRLDNARLFPGDGGQRVSQLLGMVEADAGDDGNRRLADIGRIEPSAQADFEHGGLHFPPHVPQGDHGHISPYGEAYPKVVSQAVKAWAPLGVPLYVTENGVPDRDDRLRPWLMVQSLIELRRMWQQGYDVRGYFHWSLVDNYEWTEGWRLRFGLYALDEQTQQRTARPSAELYRQIIADGGIRRETVKMYEKEPESPAIE